MILISASASARNVVPAFVSSRLNQKPSLVTTTWMNLGELRLKVPKM